MYLKQTCNIEFETKDGTKYRLRGLHAYEAKKSVHQIVQTCKLELPLSILYRNNDILERVKLIDKIKEGDKVTINLGYNDDNKKEFEGYIKRINPKMPLELEIEDSMYLLRKIRLKKSFKKNDVKDVVTYILDELYQQQGVRFELYHDMPKHEVTNFWLKDGTNGIMALQQLSDTIVVLNSYLTEIDGKPTLYVGLMYGLKKKTVNYVFNRNTISLDDLKYNQPGDRTFKVEIRQTTSAGIEKKYVFGDPNGENCFSEPVEGDMSEADIKLRAEGILEQNKAAGYKGGFTTFLIPNVEPADIGNCSDPQFKERGGNYYISTVTTNFGSGARRKPEIEIKL
jgi:hypothetical protein